MQAMTLGCGTQSPSATAVATADLTDPASPHDPGIYLLVVKGQERNVVQLEPTTFAQTKSGGLGEALKVQVTRGIKKEHWKAVVRGDRAALRTDSTRPVFYFHFGTKASPHTSPWVGWFAEASSPRQFTLVKLEAKRKSRELIVAEWGITGYAAGTREKDLVPFDFEKIGPGIYKVSPRENLPPGEYCFFHTGTDVAYGAQGGQLFDFGVDPRR
jgi:hypothetical protein